MNEQQNFGSSSQSSSDLDTLSGQYLGPTHEYKFRVDWLSKKGRRGRIFVHTLVGAIAFANNISEAAKFVTWQAI